MNSLVLFAFLWTSFANPSNEAKPWTYYFMQNTLTDKQTVSEEIADIHRLGFSGILLTDSRGYWVDDDHLLLPTDQHIRWGSDEWLDLMEHVIRECAKHDIRMALNVAASGGHLRGEEDVKGDNPKYLAYRLYRPGEVFEKPESPYFRDVATFTLKVDGEPDFDGAWHGAGDGIFSTAASASKRRDGEYAKRMPAVVDKNGNVVVRFGSDIMPNIPNDIDVLDRTAVRRHLDKVIGKLAARVPGLVGTDRAFAYCYNVSWEGMMPTWSATFAEDYRRYAGYDLMPLLPVLAGFDLKGAKPYAELMRDYRASRGKMMCDHMYGEVKRWAHERGMGAISESGGPWPRNPQTFGEQDQLAFLAANDVPQGEFWPTANNCSPDARHAVRYGRFIDRGPVFAGRTYDLPIVSSESFTHMQRHYSVDPAFLKPLGDITLANGINRIVWHTYSTSPRRYGCPGVEYFAGSHINRNVTWTKDLPAFISYLARCQALLQWGHPVVDIAVKGGVKPYTGWATKQNGFFRQKVSDEMDVVIPKGYEFDVVGDDALAKNPKLLERYRTVWPAKIDYAPDVETSSDWLWTHRTDGRGTDVYFLAGEGEAKLTFRAAAKSVEVWDAVNVTRTAAKATPTADGRTTVDLTLPIGGSCFVVFSPAVSKGASRSAASKVECQTTVPGPWQVSFENHPFIMTAVPAPMTMTDLIDWTTQGSGCTASVTDASRVGASTDLRYFSGTATYRTTVVLPTRDASVTGKSPRYVLSLGKVPSGIAHVFVNDVDCGTVWCEPWEADITKALAALNTQHSTLNICIRYTNNWYNRFVGDCFLPEGEHVLKSNVRSWAKNRERGEQAWRAKPTVYSGYCPNDPLQPSGLLGPVKIIGLGE